MPTPVMGLLRDHLVQHRIQGFSKAFAQVFGGFHRLLEQVLVNGRFDHVDQMKFGLKFLGQAERVFQVCERDWWRCMWSQRFHLNAEMGPKLHGLDVTVDPPDGKITDADVKHALQVKGEQGGLQTWYTYAMRECERACVPPHLRREQ